MSLTALRASREDCHPPSRCGCGHGFRGPAAAQEKKEFGSWSFSRPTSFDLPHANPSTNPSTFVPKGLEMATESSSIGSYFLRRSCALFFLCGAYPRVGCLSKNEERILRLTNLSRLAEFGPARVRKHGDNWRLCWARFARTFACAATLESR
jgi:hypothetical protein